MGTQMPILRKLLETEATNILMSREASKITMLSATKADSMSLIRRVHSEAFVIRVVIKLLNETCKLVKNDLSGDDIVTLSEVLLQDFWMLKIDDFVLCLRNGTKGKYGKIYGTLHFPHVLDWFRKYQESKDGLVIGNSENDHLHSKQDIDHGRKRNKEGETHLTITSVELDKLKNMTQEEYDKSKNK